MRDRLFQPTFHAFLLGRDTWITAAIVGVAMILIPQGRQILAKVALEPEYWWSTVGTTFWCLSAYHFTRLKYRYALDQRYRDVISQSQASTMAMLAGLVPITIILIGMHVAVPNGLTVVEQATVPFLSLVAFLIIVAVSRLVSTRIVSSPTGDKLAGWSTSVLFAVFIVPGLILLVLGFLRRSTPPGSSRATR